VSTYTFRIHRFNTENVDAGKIDKNNQYFVEDVEADTVEQALSSLRAKYGDETESRIFLRKVS